MSRFAAFCHIEKKAEPAHSKRHFRCTHDGLPVQIVLQAQTPPSPPSSRRQPAPSRHQEREGCLHPRRTCTSYRTSPAEVAIVSTASTAPTARGRKTTCKKVARTETVGCQRRTNNHLHKNRRGARQPRATAIGAERGRAKQKGICLSMPVSRTKPLPPSSGGVDI